MPGYVHILLTSTRRLLMTCLRVVFYSLDMNSTNRIVISSTTARRQPPVIIIPDAVATNSLAHWLMGQSPVARASQAMIACGLVGAICNQAFGVGAAMVLAILVAPVLAGTIVMSLAARGDYAETALQTSVLAAVATPILLLPSAVLGWLGAPLWALAAGLARTAVIGLNR